MSGVTRTKRLQIALELEGLGFRKGTASYSREYKRLYQQAYRRANPTYASNSWAEYYKKKGKDWNRERIKAWRKANPLKWQKIMKKAAKNGLFRRHYERHRTNEIERVKQYFRRRNPIHGTAGAIKSGDIDTIIKEFERAIVQLVEGGS